jgi:O-antigen/teichoic acid export membrane protein
MSAGRTIVGNSFWYGLETLLETVVFFGTSVVVARALGPEKLGYFSYINLFVSVLTSTGGSGLAAATGKYMAQFIGREQFGLARAVYNFTYRYQLLGALVATVVGVSGMWFFGDKHFRVMSCILILSIIPGVMSWVPAQANLAFEEFSKNAKSAFGYIFAYSAVILLTLHFHWDLVGIASASLVGRMVEVVLRTVPLHAKLRALPLEPLPAEIAKLVRRFCFQAMGIQFLMAVVWNRSELIFLRRYSTLEQMGLYSTSAGLASKLLLVPRTFGSATAVTLMVESSRDPERVDSIVKNASRYLLLVAVPVHLGAAAIASEAIRFAYGARYAGAVPVMVIASILSLPLAFQQIPDTLINAADRQRRIFLWLAVTGVLNMGLDWAFIRHHGAVGAAWGNGLAQGFGLCALWMEARRYYTFSFPRQAAARLLLAGSIMAAVALALVRTVHGLPGLVLAVAVSTPLYILLVKLFHGLEASDRERLSMVGSRLPGPLRRAYSATIAFVTPPLPSST